MSRVSQEELYNDKDVITQILKLKDTVNDYAGGIIENIYISGNDLVIEWEDGTSISLPLPDPVTGISSVTGNVSGGDLTITFYFTNGTTHSFTCPLSGMATEAYVDAGLATKADASDVYTITEVNNLITAMTLHATVDGSVSIANNAEVDTPYIDITTPGLYLLVTNAQIATGSDAFLAVGWRKDGESSNWLSNDYLPYADNVRASGSAVVNFTAATRIYGRIYQRNGNSQDLTATYVFSAVRVA